MEEEAGNTPDDILEDAIERFKVTMENEEENRKNFLEWLRFYSGDQWSELDRNRRNQTKRPMMTENQIKQYVLDVVNEFAQNPPGIKVRPRDDRADVMTANILEAHTRQIEDMSKARAIYQEAGKYSTIGGQARWRVNLKYTSDDVFEKDLVIEPFADPLAILPGPASQADYSDMEYCFVEQWVDEKEYDGKVDETGEAWEDALTNCEEGWKKDDKIRLVEYWYREPETVLIAQMPDKTVIDWTPEIEKQFTALGMQPMNVREVTRDCIWQAVLSSTSIIDGPNKWPGKYIPIVFIVGEELTIDGKKERCGKVKDGMDAQRALNYAESTLYEKMALAPKAPYIGPKKAFEGLEQIWASANTDNHAYLPYNDDAVTPPQRNVTDTVSQGEMALSQSAANNLRLIMGARDQTQLDPRVESGKAILAKQKAYDKGSFHYVNNINRGVEFTGRILVDLIPRVYNADRTIRLLGDDGESQAIKLGQPMIHNGQQYVIDLTRGKYDVTIASGPSYTTQREEAATVITNLIQADPQSSSILAPWLFSTMDWPKAKEIGDQLRQQAGQQKPPQDPLMVAQQTEQMKVQAQLQINNAKNQGDYQLAQEKQKLAREQAQFDAQMKIQVMEKDHQYEMAKLGATVQMKQEEAFHKARADRQVIEQDASPFLEALTAKDQADAQRFDQLSQSIMQLAQIMTQGHQDLIKAHTAPRVAIRDKQGNLTGSQVVLQ